MDQLKLALDTGEPHLTSEQISIVNECMTRKSFGMSIPMGQGKCAAFNTPTLMYDGSIKMVQDVKIGDLLMGDDSQPRKVLSLGRGRDIMYDVIPQKGETYTFNSKHILSLKCTNIGVKQVNNKWQATWFNNQTIKTQSKNFEYETEAKEYLKQFTDESKICDIEIKEYLKLPEYMKDMLKLYRVPVNFPCKEVPFDPYTIGLWIGDGDSNGPGFTSQDSAIIVYLKKKLPEYDMYLSHTKEYEYRIMGFNNKNRFLNVLHELNLLNNKHIPDLYMVNSRQVRLELLAGLIDTDGHLNDNSYEFTQKDEKTMDGVIYLARSLGFAAYKAVKTTSWTYKGIKQNGIAWRTTISGTINEIPVKIERKKAQPSQQPKDVLVTSFKLLEKGEDDYYGFEISGNHRYLLGNFTVTHNTIMANIVALKKLLNQEITEPILVIASKSLLASWELEITKFFGDALIYQLMNVDSRNFVLQDDTMLVLTTPETAAKFYKDNLINEKFITYEKYDDGGPFPRTKNVYDSPQFPYLKHAIGGSILYQKKWGCLIIDEAHKYTKISTRRCQALAAISAHNLTLAWNS